MKSIIEFKNTQDAKKFIDKFPDLEFEIDNSFVKGKFSKQKLCGADFSGVNFHEGDFRWSDISWGKFSGADFRNADFSAVNFHEAKFGGAEFFGVDFRWSNFHGANFERAIFKGANLSWTNFCGANFHGADFWGANMSYANMSHTTVICISAIGSVRKDNIYGSPVWDKEYGNQTGWIYHLGCRCGTYAEMQEEVLNSYGDGTYSQCLEMLQKIAMMIFNPY